MSTGTQSRTGCRTNASQKHVLTSIGKTPVAPSIQTSLCSAVHKEVLSHINKLITHSSRTRLIHYLFISRPILQSLRRLLVLQNSLTSQDKTVFLDPRAVGRTLAGELRRECFTCGGEPPGVAMSIRRTFLAEHSFGKLVVWCRLGHTG